MSEYQKPTRWLEGCRLSIVSIFVLFLLVTSVNKTYGSHAMGTELTYVCLGNNTYEFTMYFYRDCGGIAVYDDCEVCGS